MNLRIPFTRRTMLAAGAGVLAAVSLLASPGTAHAAAPAAVASDSGDKIYARWCVHCHGAGRGNPGTQSLQVKYGGRIPALLLDRTDLPAAAVTQFVRQGVQSMPPFRKTEITDAELAVLAAWVASGGGKR